MPKDAFVPPGDAAAALGTVPAAPRAVVPPTAVAVATPVATITVRDTAADCPTVV